MEHSDSRPQSLPAPATPDPSSPGVKTLCVILPFGELYSQGGGAIATVTRNVVRLWEEQGIAVTVLATGASPPATTGTAKIGGGSGNSGPSADLYPEGGVVPIPGPPVNPGVVGRARTGIGGRLRAVESRLAPWGGADSRRHRRAVRRLLRTLPVRPEVVVVHNEPLMAKAVRQAVPRARSVLWLHNEVDPRCFRPRRFFVNPTLVVAVSRYVAQWTERRYRLSSGCVRVVHNGVDLERFHPAVGAPEGRGPGAEVPPKKVVSVVCHGRIDPNKGFHLAVTAVERLRREGYEVTLTVAGAVQVWHLSAAEAAAYRDSLVADLEAAGGTYLGRLDPSEVPALLRAHDIACVPSLAEDPFPLAGLEAMASGCALVVSRRGGLPEMAGDAAVLFDPDDPDGLTAALRPLVADPDTLGRRRRAARIRSEEFPWAATAAGIIGPARSKSMADESGGDR